MHRILPKDSCDEHVSSYCNFNIAVSLIFRYEKIKERNEPLVEFLKTNEVKVCIIIQQRSTCMYKLLQMKSNEDCFVTSYTGTITEWFIALGCVYRIIFWIFWEKRRRVRNIPLTSLVCPRQGTRWRIRDLDPSLMKAK